MRQQPQIFYGNGKQWLLRVTSAVHAELSAKDLDPATGRYGEEHAVAAPFTGAQAPVRGMIAGMVACGLLRGKPWHA